MKLDDIRLRLKCFKHYREITGDYEESHGPYVEYLLKVIDDLVSGAKEGSFCCDPCSGGCDVEYHKECVAEAMADI